MKKNFMKIKTAVLCVLMALFMGIPAFAADASAPLVGDHSNLTLWIILAVIVIIILIGVIILAIVKKKNK